MRILDVEQGSELWKAARLGIPTASDFKKIITPVEGKLSKTRTKFIATLIGERYTGAPLDETDTRWMKRGKEQEPNAVAWYELTQHVKTQQVGFVMHENGLCGASPDGLVGDDGGLEIKTRSMQIHLEALLYGIPKGCKPQVQASLWITERKWWDVLLYNPALPPVLERWERDEAYIETMAKAVVEMAKELDAMSDKHGVPLDWLDRATKRAGERAAIQAEEERFFPNQEAVEDPDLEARRKWLNELRGRKHATDTQTAFEAGAQVQ